MSNPYQAPAASDPGQARDPHGLQVSARMLDALKGTHPWVRLLSVFMFVITAFMVLGSIGLFAAGALGDASYESLGLGVVYLLMTMLYAVPAILLHRYASALGRLRYSDDAEDIEAALERQQSFWRIVGIMVLVMLVLYFAMFAVGGVMMAVRMLASG